MGEKLQFTTRHPDDNIKYIRDNDCVDVGGPESGAWIGRYRRAPLAGRWRGQIVIHVEYICIVEEQATRPRRRECKERCIHGGNGRVSHEMRERGRTRNEIYCVGDT